MTSVPVNDIGALGKVPYVNEPNGMPQGKGSDFMGKFKSALETQATVLNMTETQTMASPADNTQATDNVKDLDEVNRTDKAGSDRDQVKSEVKKQESGTEKGKEQVEEKEDASPETVQAISETLQDITNKIAEELNVLPEDVITAIDDLGLEITDLLDPNTMTDLVSAISGEQDAVVLLTDEELYQTLGDLQDYVVEAKTDLINKLDLSQEALNEVLVQTEDLIRPSYEDETDPIPAEAVMRETPLEGMKDYKVTTTVNGETVSMDVKVDDATGTQTVTAVQTDGSQDADSRDSSNERSGHGMNKDDSSPEPLFTQTTQFNNEISNTDPSASADEIAGFRTEASDIANQIMDNMRANLRADVTELEMNLHPASLGNVRVNLQSQNGQITAQFLAQNESVRAAIESQVVQLKESLESQGIKIEQVEVAIASQGFDRNRDNGQGQDDNRERGQSGNGVGRVGRTRRIDLNAMDGEELEELDDADRITAEMMASEGNTVDYKA